MIRASPFVDVSWRKRLILTLPSTIIAKTITIASRKKTNENAISGLSGPLNKRPISSNPPPNNFPIALDRAWASPQIPTKVPATYGIVRSSMRDNALFVAIPAASPNITITKYRPFTLPLIPVPIRSRSEPVIIQRPIRAVESFPSRGVTQSPPNNRPTRVPQPQ